MIHYQYGRYQMAPGKKDTDLIIRDRLELETQYASMQQEAARE